MRPRARRAATVARDTQISQVGDGCIKDESVVTTFTALLAWMSRRFWERLSSVEEADPVTENLLEDTFHELEKTHRMFQAQK